MKYTVRGIPATLDAAQRERAQAEGRSLNGVTLDALAEGLRLTEVHRKKRDLSDIAGTWKADEAFDAALAAQDRVDEGLCH